ncbi:MAG: hypothetical protein JXB17_02855 [Bacteroidales bacterium]|nr:hypothetical protein [Bacteroidales bacterium]
MMDHILVCPFNEKLLSRLKQRAVVINTEDFNIIRYINRELDNSNKLHAIKIQTEKPLSEITFQEEWGNIPLAIYSPEFGEYKKLLYQLNLIRKLNVRIFLSSQYEFNFTGLRILSSLNIACGIYFNEEPQNWDLINDLMHYAIYSNATHAPIEPFNWVALNYQSTEYIDYSVVYFNNPTKYLHLNDKEQIALTAEDLVKGNYIDQGIKSLNSINKNRKYIHAENSRYETMLQMNECAFCNAFRICLAKFPSLTNKNETCKLFFSDFLDAADYALSKRNKGNQLWQL